MDTPHAACECAHEHGTMRTAKDFALLGTEAALAFLKKQMPDLKDCPRTAPALSDKTDMSLGCNSGKPCSAFRRLQLLARYPPFRKALNRVLARQDRPLVTEETMRPKPSGKGVSVAEHVGFARSDAQAITKLLNEATEEFAATFANTGDCRVALFAATTDEFMLLPLHLLIEHLAAQGVQVVVAVLSSCTVAERGKAKEQCCFAPSEGAVPQSTLRDDLERRVLQQMDNERKVAAYTGKFERIERYRQMNTLEGVEFCKATSQFAIRNALVRAFRATRRA